MEQAQDIKRMIDDIEKLFETGIIDEYDYMYQTEHYRMKYYELTGEMPD